MGRRRRTALAREASERLEAWDLYDISLRRLCDPYTDALASVSFLYALLPILLVWSLADRFVHEVVPCCTV
jgi:hypothetical protein